MNGNHGSCSGVPGLGRIGQLPAASGEMKGKNIGKSSVRGVRHRRGKRYSSGTGARIRIGIDTSIWTVMLVGNAGERRVGDH